MLAWPELACAGLSDSDHTRDSAQSRGAAHTVKVSPAERKSIDSEIDNNGGRGERGPGARRKTGSYLCVCLFMAADSLLGSFV